jgi:transcriptional regulator with XRE-family HTH domain
MEPNEIRRLNLLRLMADRGWDEHKLADLYGCTREYAVALMKGTGTYKRGIGPGTIEKLVKIFKVDKEEFSIMPDDPDFWLKVHKIRKGEFADDLKELVETIFQAHDKKIDPEALKLIVFQAKYLRKKPS